MFIDFTLEILFYSLQLEKLFSFWVATVLQVDKSINGIKIQLFICTCSNCLLTFSHMHWAKCHFFRIIAHTQCGTLNTLGASWFFMRLNVFYLIACSIELNFAGAGETFWNWYAHSGTVQRRMQWGETAPGSWCCLMLPRWDCGTLNAAWRASIDWHEAARHLHREIAMPWTDECSQHRLPHDLLLGSWPKGCGHEARHREARFARGRQWNEPSRSLFADWVGRAMRGQRWLDWRPEVDVDFDVDVDVANAAGHAALPPRCSLIKLFPSSHFAEIQRG